MSDPIDGRELLAIRARTMRAREGLHQSLWRTEMDRDLLLREVYRLRRRDAVASAAWVFADEMRGYCSPHGVAARYADRLEELLRLAESPAAAPAGTSAAPATSDGAREAQEG